MSTDLTKKNEENPHYFLSEELLAPMMCHSDPQRLNMFTSQIPQTLSLAEPDRPKVFSGFENKFGEFNSAQIFADDDYEIISVFEKNFYQKIYALKSKTTGKMHIHFQKIARHLTESYGYILDAGILKDEPCEISKGDLLQTNSNYDEFNNFMYGKNLKVLNINKDGKTYEDSIIVSESASEMLSHYSIDKIEISMNLNDVLLNLLEEEGEYKSFPNPGEEIQNGVLASRRRLSYDSIISNLNTASLKQILPNDKIFYSSGVVVDIDIYSNYSLDYLKKNKYNNQILELHEKHVELSMWMKDVFGFSIQNGNYTEELSYWYTRYTRSLDHKWKRDGIEFEGCILQFTIAKLNKATKGSKLANRYGGKGTIGMILPDDKMPKSSDGQKIDIIVNSLGILGRLNMSQSYEQEINFCTVSIIKRLKSEYVATIHTCEKIISELEKYMYFFTKRQHQEFVKFTDSLTDEEKLEFVKEVFETETLYIEQPPFYDTVGYEGLNAIYDEFGIEKITVEGIESPMIVGDVYYIKLKHEPFGKMSVRSAKHLSIAGVPIKNSNGFKTNIDHHGSTPIRFGEQETENILTCNHPEAVDKLYRLYATNEKDRANLITTLATQKDPLAIPEVELDDSNSKPASVLRAYLEILGLEIEDEDLDQQSNDSNLPEDGECHEYDN